MKSIPLLAGFILMCTASNFTSVAAEPTAASTAFTSKNPTVRKALDLAQSGKFKEAEALLVNMNKKDGSEALRAREEAIDILHRVRVEYALDADGLLIKVR